MSEFSREFKPISVPSDHNLPSHAQVAPAHYGFRKLLIVAEPCYAECVVTDLDGIPGVLAMTGANELEQSWADNWNPSGSFWMSDRFTQNFVTAITENPAITYRDQEDKSIFELTLEKRLRLNIAQASLALYSARAFFDILRQNNG